MGTGSKVCSVILRLGELCCAAIVVGQLSRFFWLLDRGPNSSTNGRLIYAEVMSCLALICSIVLIIPAKYSFYAWPLDLVFFISLMVAFGLLAALNQSCTSTWYRNYWGYYWGRFWTIAPPGVVSVNTIGRTGCANWRSILAFLFIGSFTWLLSAILGIVVSTDISKDRETNRTHSIKEKFLHKGNNQMVDTEAQT